MSSPGWITDHSAIADRLYKLSTGDTFAIKTNESWGEMVKYVRVTGGSYPDTRNYSETSLAEPHDIVLDGECGKSPSANHFESMSISHDPGTETVYWKRGVGRFDRLAAVSLRPMAVSYEADVTTAARCECGQTTKVAVAERTQPTVGDGMKRDSDGNLVTPCCRSRNWETVLVDDA